MATTETRTYRNYIGGDWVDAVSGETFESTSPADGELIGTFPRSGAEDVDRAVAAAKEAYEEWRLVPAPKRGEILFRFAQLVADDKDELADLMTHEMGKVLRGGRRRRPGSDRHDLLHGRRGPAPVRADDAVGAPEQVPDVGPHADRRHRR